MGDYEIEIEQCEYEEDKVVKGVLCFALGGKWIEYSKEALTEMLLTEQSGFDAYVNRVWDERECACQ